MRYALWDATGWHRDYSPPAWRNRTTEEQKRIGREMAVRIKKVIATVLDEAHKRQGDPGRGAGGPVQAASAAVATYVSDLPGEADKVAAHVDVAIARETDTMRDPDGLAKAWLDKLQSVTAAGLMTLDELGDRLRALDEERAVAERELGRLRDTQRQIEELEASKEAVLRMFGTGLLVGIEWFPPHLRRAVYELLAMRV